MIARFNCSRFPLSLPPLPPPIRHSGCLQKYPFQLPHDIVYFLWRVVFLHFSIFTFLNRLCLENKNKMKQTSFSFVILWQFEVHIDHYSVSALVRRFVVRRAEFSVAAWRLSLERGTRRVRLRSASPHAWTQLRAAFFFHSARDSFFFCRHLSHPFDSSNRERQSTNSFRSFSGFHFSVLRRQF